MCRVHPSKCLPKKTFRAISFHGASYLPARHESDTRVLFGHEQADQSHEDTWKRGSRAIDFAELPARFEAAIAR